MTDDGRTTSDRGEELDERDHPEELLAAYVDGEVSDAERERVDAHIATCARCSKELALAARARDSLAAVPELQAPWEDGAGEELSFEPAADVVAIDGARTAAATEAARGRRSGSSPASHRRRPGSRRVAVSTAVGLGVAAALAVVVLLVHTGSGSGGTAASDVTASPTVLTTKAIDALAGSLAQAGTRSPAEIAGAPVAPVPGATTSAGSSKAAFSADSAATCARSAAGLAAASTVVYLQPGVLNGQQVWVIGYAVPDPTGTVRHVEVVAVSRPGCAVVYVARQPTAT